MLDEGTDNNVQREQNERIDVVLGRYVNNTSRHCGGARNSSRTIQCRKYKMLQCAE